MKKNLLILASILALSTTALTACSEEKSSENVSVITEAETADNSNFNELKEGQPKREKGKRIIGKVTNLSDKSVTLKTAQMPEREPLSEDSSSMEMPKGERPQEPKDMPQGEAPQGEKGQPPMNKHNDLEPVEMNFDGEEITLEIDETKLFKMGEAPEDRKNASFSEITQDSVLTIIYEEDGETIKEILLKAE